MAILCLALAGRAKQSAGSLVREECLERWARTAHTSDDADHTRDAQDPRDAQQRDDADQVQPAVPLQQVPMVVLGDPETPQQVDRKDEDQDRVGWLLSAVSISRVSQVSKQ